jgi:phosphinothricin acetyltransferase
VAERGGAVVGFASWVPYSAREAYGGIGEYTVYVARSARGGRIGSALIADLVVRAEQAGMWKLMSRILTTNAPSLALARRHGFREVGLHLRHSRLDGEWRDVAVVERLLGPAAED